MDYVDISGYEVTTFEMQLILSFQVCEGDTVIVNVRNDMYNFEATTIHWHGIHQIGTGHMDGVGMISQCPILPTDKWAYRYVATKTEKKPSCCRQNFQTQLIQRGKCA